MNRPIKTAPLIADALGLTDIERLVAALTEQVQWQPTERGDVPAVDFMPR